MSFWFKETMLIITTQTNQNVGQCPTRWPPCRIQVAHSVQHRKVWLTPNTGVPCSNAAKTRNPLLGCAKLPDRSQPLVCRSSPYCVTWRRYCCLTSFYRLSIRALVAKIWPDKVVRWCPDGDFFGEFLGPAFPATRVQHISDLHSKFALGPHHLSKYGIDIQSATAEIRRVKKKERKNQKGGPMPNVMAALPNIGGALCSTPQSLANAYYYNAVQ